MRIEIVLTDGASKAVESTQSTAMPDEYRSESRRAAPADDRLREWEKHGSHRWGLGVAVDLCDLEQRVAALEKNHDGACGRQIVPLYAHPQPTLTDAEREAVSQVYDLLCDRSRELQSVTRLNEARPLIQWAKTLRGLLERLGGGR